MCSAKRVPRRRRGGGGGGLLAELRMQGGLGRAASFKAETRFPGMPSETLSSSEDPRRSLNSAKWHPATSHSTTKYHPTTSPLLFPRGLSQQSEGNISNAFWVELQSLDCPFDRSFWEYTM